MAENKSDLSNDIGFTCDKCKANKWDWKAAESPTVDMYACRTIGCGNVVHITHVACDDAITMPASKPEAVDVTCRRDAQPCAVPCRWAAAKAGECHDKQKKAPSLAVVYHEPAPSTGTRVVGFVEQAAQGKAVGVPCLKCGINAWDYEGAGKWTCRSCGFSHYEQCLDMVRGKGATEWMCRQDAKLCAVPCRFLPNGKKKSKKHATKALTPADSNTWSLHVDGPDVKAVGTFGGKNGEIVRDRVKDVLDAANVAPTALPVSAGSLPTPLPAGTEIHGNKIAGAGIATKPKEKKFSMRLFP